MGFFSLLFSCSSILFLILIGSRMMSILDDFKHDRTEARWIDRLIYHEVGEFSDLKQQVDIQSVQLGAMKSFNSRLNNKLHKYSHEDNIAMDADDLVSMVRNIESEDFTDIWIDDIHKTISSTHSKRKKTEKSKAKKASSAAKNPAKTGSKESEQCNSKKEIDMILNQHLKLVKAAGAPDYASTMLGGSIAYKNRLTSPSYPERGQIISSTMRHVLGLQAKFPAPEYVITPVKSSEDDTSTQSSQAAAGGTTPGPGGLITKGQQHCWAFPNQKGILTIQLAQPMYATHVSYRHRLSKESTTSPLEISASPKFVHVWSLSSLYDEHPINVGSFWYDINGPDKQTFALTNTSLQSSLLTFEVKSNNGNKDFTCLHKIQVHSVTD